MTSHDVVAFIRRRFGVRKVGHAGTLDPQAQGLLVVLLGRATRDSSLFLGQDKEYQATLLLGEVRDTGDREGRIIAQREVPALTDKEIRETFRTFIGEQEQIPPMYSSIKYRGRPLHRLARQGKVVARAPRTIVIKELEVLRIELPRISFRVLSSKGTYIRTLAQDIGRALGPGATLVELERTKSGDYSLRDAIAWEKLSRLSPEELAEHLR